MPRAQREQLILDAAGVVFAREGYHPASMDEIASPTDVSKPMLYAYFGSKEGLYVAYVDRTGRELVTRLESAATVDLRPVERLRPRIIEFLTFVEEHRDGWRVLFQAVSSSRPLADEVAALRERIAAAVRRMVESAVGGTPGSGLSGPASDALAHAIVGAGESLANWWLEHPEVSRDRVADWYVDLVHAAVAGAVRRCSEPGESPGVGPTGIR
jgi:AcrR family transcriptional regulator